MLEMIDGHWVKKTPKLHLEIARHC